MEEESLREIKDIYDLVIEAGTYPMASIRTAEEIKVAENSRHDINIALMNELRWLWHTAKGCRSFG